MKIAVVNLPSVDGGGLAILNSFYHYIMESNPPMHEWLFIVSNQNLHEKNGVHVKKYPEALRNYFSRLIIERSKIPGDIRAFHADVVFSFQNLILPKCKCKQALYMHQSLPFQKKYRFSLWKKEERDCAIRQRLLGVLIKSSVKKADLVMVQTRWVCNAVQESTKCFDKVIHIGYPMPGGAIDCKIRREAPGQDFFYPAGPAIYKNFGCLNEAVNQLHDEGYAFQVYLTLTRPEFEKMIHYQKIHDIHYCFLGRIPFENVKELYHRHIVLFPSYIETLGLPLIEARSSGCYIIASDCPFSHEILDDYENKTFADPFDSKQLALAMKTVLDGKASYISNAHREYACYADCWKRAVDLIGSL